MSGIVRKARVTFICRASQKKLPANPPCGAVMSDSVRLWVTPQVGGFIGGNFTNFDGSRLPYFYVLPPNYDPAQKYPLLCWLHGSPGDETSIVTPNTVYSNGQPLAASSPLKVFASLGRQQTDPGILLWVTRRAAQTFQKVEPASESLFPGMHDFRKTDRLEDIFEGGVVAHTVPGWLNEEIIQIAFTALKTAGVSRLLQ